jgi:hypothetical protein
MSDHDQVLETQQCPECSASPTVSLCERCGQCEDCCGCSHCQVNDHPCETTCSNCECCDDHCECRHCDRCGNAVDADNYCSDCDRCEDCCSCQHCEACQCRIDDDDFCCGDCGRCDDCCTCREEANVEFFRPQKPKFHQAHKGQFKRNGSRRYIACELEVARIDSDNNVSDVIRRWKGGIVEDGSLSDGGFEICTAPAQGDVFCEQIEEVCRALNDGHASVDTSCGYHVHVDARDFGYWDIRRLILLYAKIEDALFSLVPNSRRESNYCVPCGQKYVAGLENVPKTKTTILDNVYRHLKDFKGKEKGDRLKEYRGDKYNTARYHALNLHSWLYRGTIECRLAAGTIKSEKVIQWALLWAGILDYAYKSTEKAITSLQGGSWDILMLVAPESVRPWLSERRDKFTTNT